MNLCARGWGSWDVNIESVKRQDVFAGVGTESSLVDRIVRMSEAVEMYKLFDKGDVGKVLFEPWE